MANVTQLANLKNAIPILGPGYAAFIEGLSRNIPFELKISDGLTYYYSNALTTTAVAIKASAGKVYGVYIQSAGAIAYVSLWNVAQGSVTVGTTSQQFALGVTATTGHDNYALMAGSSGNGTSPLWSTAITAAVATTVTGSSAAASLPTIVIAYA